MRTISLIGGLSALLLATAPAVAETMKSRVAFNTGAQKPAATQPAGGVAKTWEVTLSGGTLDGCKVNIVEDLFPRDNGSWGVFEFKADVTCAKGTFKFSTTGSWDQNGFHGAGLVGKDGRSGDFSELKGRVAQIGARIVPAAAAGTYDVTYDLIVDPM